jgi:hypothetical protein
LDKGAFHGARNILDGAFIRIVAVARMAVAAHIEV